MKSTERFSDRVANYRQYRPSYPSALIDTLCTRCRLSSESIIADIGSGTGKLAQLLLSTGSSVIGVEPNDAMREAAEALLAEDDNYNSLAGDSAETGLDDHSVDLVTAAQAFHWFEPVATRREFQRILKPGGSVALIWNQREVASPFQREYDQLLATHCAQYKEVNHRNIRDEDIAAFFQPGTYELHTFPYAQHLHKPGFLGRMFSSSYTPKQGTSAAAALIAEAESLFDRYQADQLLEFSYQTRLYLASDLYW